MQEISLIEISIVCGAYRPGEIYIGPDGAPFRDGMPIWISIDQAEIMNNNRIG